MSKDPPPPRLFFHSPIDWRDEFEEKFDRVRGVLSKVAGSGSERETHDALVTGACRDQKTHDDLCLGLLATILTDKDLATKSFRDLTIINRDSMAVVVDQLSLIIAEKYGKLTDISRNQLLWLIREMVRGGMNGADVVCWNLMRQIAGGDVSNRNLWLSETMLDVFAENRSWLDKFPILIASAIYTYLRILEDHTAPNIASLKQKEVNFVVSLIREHFMAVCMNSTLGLGRDFLRLLQSVSRIPEVEVLWKELFCRPGIVSPIGTLLSIRTSRKYLQSRLTPDMEKKILFLTNHVRFGNQKRYQDWFQRQYLSTPESHTLRADIIRFIVGVIHPPNEILCSDILPRWAVIGWLLTTCTNPVAAANAKLALFYDWLVFDPAKDNIMNIEPGILVMFHSLRPHLAISATLLDFLVRLTNEFWPSGGDKIKDGVGAALRTILDKKVLSSLEPLLEHSKLDSELRASVQENLVVLLDRGREEGSRGNEPRPTNNTESSLPLIISPSPAAAPIPPSKETIKKEPQFSDEEEEDSPTVGSSVEEAERSSIFHSLHSLHTTIRMGLENLFEDSSSESLFEFTDSLFDLTDLDDVRRKGEVSSQVQVIARALVFIYKDGLSKSPFNDDLNAVPFGWFVTPVKELILQIFEGRENERSARSRIVISIFLEMIDLQPTLPHKIILVLNSMVTDDSPGVWINQDVCGDFYRSLCTTRGGKFEGELLSDLKNCWEHEPLVLASLAPVLYSWFKSELIGNVEILRLFVSALDPVQLQDLLWRIIQGQFVLLDDHHLVPTLTKTLEWETWEQHCVWTLIGGHSFDPSDFLSLLTLLEAGKNAEATTALLLLLKNTKTSMELICSLLCRRPSPNDRFLVSLLSSWAKTDEENLAEVLGLTLVKASGSPTKRNRGVKGIRGVSSPAGPALPSVDNVLAHLDHLRKFDDKRVFRLDSLRAALLQIQLWANEGLMSKYANLFALAAAVEDPEREGRTSSKRSPANIPRKAAPSPTLSRTRSGRTRTPLKDSSSSSEDEEEAQIPKKKPKRKKNAFNSDSD